MSLKYWVRLVQHFSRIVNVRYIYWHSYVLMFEESHRHVWKLSLDAAKQVHIKVNGIIIPQTHPGYQPEGTTCPVSRYLVALVKCLSPTSREPVASIQKMLWEKRLSYCQAFVNFASWSPCWSKSLHLMRHPSIFQVPNISKYNSEYKIHQSEKRSHSSVLFCKWNTFKYQSQ